MLDSIYPVFVTCLTSSPERARLKLDSPLTLSSGRTAKKYSSFFNSVKRPFTVLLNSRLWESGALWKFSPGLIYSAAYPTGHHRIVGFKCRRNAHWIHDIREKMSAKKERPRTIVLGRRFLDQLLNCSTSFPEKDPLEADPLARQHLHSIAPRQPAPVARIGPQRREPVVVTETARGLSR